MYDNYDDKNNVTYHSTGGYGDGYYPGPAGKDSYSGYEDQYKSTYTTYSSTTGGNKKNDKKKGKFFRKAITAAALAAIFGVVSGAGFYATNYLIEEANDTGSRTESVGSVQDTETNSDSNLVNSITDSSNPQGIATVYDVTQVVDKVMPSVVSITNISTQTINSYFFGQSGTYENQSSGSGIIVGQNDTELLIVTNNHVVEGSDTLSIQFIDDSTVDAQIKGTDADMDLAVVAVPLEKISADTLNQIKVATLGDSESLQVGEPAIAIGNALGYGQSVTTGVISALNRNITIDNVTSSLIQTDAAINPGNSGGALLNMNGELIGINAVKYASSEVEGMGYAIPISAAEPIIDELMNRETRSKVDANETPYLGISPVDVTAEASQTYGIPVGVYVSQVMEGTAAEKGGLKKGDIITAFDGQKVSSTNDLNNILQYYAAGTTLDLTIQRASDNGYTEATVTVTLGKKVQQAQ